jgi:hypothetical protein
MGNQLDLHADPIDDHIPGEVAVEQELGAGGRRVRHLARLVNRAAEQPRRRALVEAVRPEVRLAREGVAEAADPIENPQVADPRGVRLASSSLISRSAFRPLLGPQGARGARFVPKRSRVQGFYQSGRPDLNRGHLVPQASQSSGERSGEVAGSGLAARFRFPNWGPSRFPPRPGFRTFGPVLGHQGRTTA